MTRILIVDDERPVRTYFGARIGLEPGLQVVDAVPDIHQAWACLQSKDVDLVLLDYRMEGGDGMELVSSISHWVGEDAAKLKRPHVLFCTGYATEAFEAEARAMGARGVVGKSDTAGELIPAIRVVARGGLWFGHRAEEPSAPLVVKPRILIGDSTRSSRAALSYLLQENGYEPVVAWSYGDLSRLLQRERFDALILDSSLPSGDCGPNALIRLTREWPTLPVLLLGTPPLGLDGYRPAESVVGQFSRSASGGEMLEQLERALNWGTAAAQRPGRLVELL